MTMSPVSRWTRLRLWWARIARADSDLTTLYAIIFAVVMALLAQGLAWYDLRQLEQQRRL